VGVDRRACGHTCLGDDRAVRSISIYGTMYGMHRTTIYLPEDLKARLAVEAKRRGVTEAQVIRDALGAALGRPRPRGGLFHSGDASWAERDEELLGELGFGE
jgi:hypothetical protein